MDYYKNGLVSLMEIKSFLLQNGVEASDRDIDLFLQECDTDKDA